MGVESVKHLVCIKCWGGCLCVRLCHRHCSLNSTLQAKSQTSEDLLLTAPHSALRWERLQLPFPQLFTEHIYFLTLYFIEFLGFFLKFFMKLQCWGGVIFAFHSNSWKYLLSWDSFSLLECFEIIFIINNKS